MPRATWERKDFLQKKAHTTTPQAKNAEEKLLAAYWKSLVNEGADNGKYGFHYFDKPSDQEEEDESEDPDAFDLDSCSANCCDRDCECDDCVRCSNIGVGEGEGESIVPQGVAG